MAEPLWFRVKAGLPNGDEARILERHLQVERAWSFAISLWDYFVIEHPSGELTGPEASYLIARRCGWTGDHDKFCAAMVAAGFLAALPDGFRVRGWRDWAGYHLEVRAKETAKKKAQRNRPPTVPVDVPGTSQGQGGEKTALGGDVPGDTSLISVSVSQVSKGGVGGKKRRGIAAADTSAARWPLTAAVLAALWDRDIDAAWPAREDAADRVEAAIAAVPLPVAVDRLAAALPAADKKWLGWHVETIRGAAKAGRGPQPVTQSEADWSKSLEDVAREREEAARAKRQ